MIAERIQELFSFHNGDGEFQCGLPDSPFTVVAPPTCGGYILVATKPSLILQGFSNDSTYAQFGLLGRYGLPAERDIPWIRRSAEERRFLFLGDMDPVDLLVFAWYRAVLGASNVMHLGVNDALLAFLQCSCVETTLCRLSSSEEAALPFLWDVVPDLADIVGRACYGFLHRRRKIEMEAISAHLRIKKDEFATFLLKSIRME